MANRGIDALGVARGPRTVNRQNEVAPPVISLPGRLMPVSWQLPSRQRRWYRPPSEPRSSRRLTRREQTEVLKRAGVEFIDENGGSAGVRLRKRRKASKSVRGVIRH